ncbi:hypothetical protein COCVIDRAFT_116441 [Bipolaris victoriae FI3]|uniref:Uncharacterized protein n=1 Tax=Bipolaris victoriae (strain FI3) TaxID=930091 RepID=W7DQM7_BIPV3|nr:hypothetical protein COCVIDRAFT_116441 [Bipolaris victoriae FI3]
MNRPSSSPSFYPRRSLTTASPPISFPSDGLSTGIHDVASGGCGGSVQQSFQNDCTSLPTNALCISISHLVTRIIYSSFEINLGKLKCG